MKDEYNKNASDLQLALWSLHITIVHDARDWAASNRDARVWAIVVGWDDDSYDDLKLRFQWSDDTVTKLKARHAAIESAKGAFPEALVQK